MKTYKIELKPISGFGSKLQADTIWGHVAWAIYYLKGEEELNDFLNKYNNDSPPILISNGLPVIKIKDKKIEYLPKIYAPPINVQEEEELQNLTGLDDIKIINVLKKLKKNQFLSFDIFNTLKNNFNYYDLYKMVFENKVCPYNFSPKFGCQVTFKECPFLKLESKDNGNCLFYINDKYNFSIERREGVYRNKINRLSTKVNEGGLFSSNYVFYEDHIFINIYIKTDLAEDYLYEIFDYIETVGFGADKSVGKGQFTYKIYEVNLPSSDNPNGFMSLSNYFLTQDSNITPTYYELEPKFPKLGEHYANSGNPFKKPLLMLHAGSVFKTSEFKDFYGGLIKNIHDNSNIVHYNYIFPLKVKVQ